MNKLAKKYASFVLMLLLVFVMIFGTMSTAYASEYKKIDYQMGRGII